MSKLIKPAIIAVALLSGIHPAVAATFTYTNIVDSSATYTQPYGINNSGTIVGQVSGGSITGQQTFQYSSGNFTIVTPPGADTSYGVTWGAISNNGEIVGNYVTTGTGLSKGFSDIGGTYSSFAVSGAALTEPTGVNNSGVIVGDYYKNSSYSGFIDTAGAITTISKPTGATFLWATGINDAGTVVGYYRDSSSITHGFTLSGSTFTSFDQPGATGTEIIGINNSGNMLVSSSLGNFFYGGGSFTAISVPGSSDTYIRSLNDSNQIVGSYDTASCGSCGNIGFLATMNASGAPEPGTIELLTGAALAAGAFVRRRTRVV